MENEIQKLREASRPHVTSAFQHGSIRLLTLLPFHISNLTPESISCRVSFLKHPVDQLLLYSWVLEISNQDAMNDLKKSMQKEKVAASKLREPGCQAVQPLQQAILDSGACSAENSDAEQVSDMDSQDSPTTRSLPRRRGRRIRGPQTTRICSRRISSGRRNRVGSHGRMPGRACLPRSRRPLKTSNRL